MFYFYYSKGASNGFKRLFLQGEIARGWLWFMNNVCVPFGMINATRMISDTLKCGWNMYDLNFFVLLHMHSNWYCWYVVLEMVLQAENCVDSEVIFSFLDSNEIGQTHAIFFISYALHMEAKNKIKTANDIFNRGLSR